MGRVRAGAPVLDATVLKPLLGRQYRFDELLFDLPNTHWASSIELARSVP
jgi:hypothetical protein